MTNLVEILKNAPEGLELYSPVVGKTKLYRVKSSDVCPIVTKSSTGIFCCFDERGRMDKDGECILFPSKENRDWDEWQFTLLKPGHFVTAMGLTFYINSKFNDDFKVVYSNGFVGKRSPMIAFQFASTEEIEHFYVELRKNGYTIKNGELKPAEKCGIRLNITASITETKEPKLINSKPFTIDDFKPFDKVLVRKDSREHWHIQFFSHYNASNSLSYTCLFDCRYEYCVPYNDETKHLIGTTEEYNGKYKTW